MFEDLGQKKAKKSRSQGAAQSLGRKRPRRAATRAWLADVAMHNLVCAAQNAIAKNAMLGRFLSMARGLEVRIRPDFEQTFEKNQAQCSIGERSSLIAANKAFERHR